MSIHWPWLLLALAVLIPPPLLSAELRRVVSSARRNSSLNVAAIVRPWQNWLDFLRGLIGTAVLTELAIASSDPKSDSSTVVLLLQVALLTVALTVQVLRWDGKAPRPEFRLQLLTPVLYLSGVTFVLSGLLAGTFAVLAGWIFAVAGKNPIYQLPAMAVGLGAAGYVFGLNTAILCNIALIVFPFVPAFALRKRMVFVGAETRWPPPPILKSRTAS